MAKKTFNDLNGVEISVENRYHPEDGYVKQNVVYGGNNVISIDYEGDIFYMLDDTNNFEIIPVIVKQRYKDWNTRRIRYSKDIEGTKTFVPGAYRSDELAKNYEKVINKIKYFEYKGNRSHIGRFFTTEDEAKEWQAKLREGKCFKLLKPGTVVYYISSETQDKPIAVTFTEIKNHEHRENEYEICFGDNGYLIIGESIWEDKLSEQIDKCFYDYRFKGDEGWNRRFFIDEKDAIKAISERKNRKQKSATDKYIKAMSNHDGKPISFTDKREKQLHYGDTVAYAVSGGSGSPFISLGKITGETKTRVNVDDLYTKGRKHSVLSCCLILIEEAKVNVNSGYSFVKTQ